jgi:hypothetical protein
VFRGTLRSDVICSVCKTVSTVYEPFLDLSLPLEKVVQQKAASPLAAATALAPSFPAPSPVPVAVPTPLPAAPAPASAAPTPPLRPSPPAPDASESSGMATPETSLCPSGGSEPPPLSASDLPPGLSLASPDPLPPLPLPLPVPMAPLPSPSPPAAAPVLQTPPPLPPAAPPVAQPPPRPAPLVLPSALSSSGSDAVLGGDAPAAGVGVGLRRRREAPVDELTLTECLEAYTAAETLSEPYKCAKCACLRPCSKQLTISKLPNVLVLHLKRFDALRSRKIEKFVSFPSRGLNLANYVFRWRAEAEKGGSREQQNGGPEATPEIPYDLFAVVEHTGSSIQQGHYKALVQERGRWFACNDAWITFATHDEALSAQGYLLFYIRRGSPPS